MAAAGSPILPSASTALARTRSLPSVVAWTRAGAASSAAAPMVPRASAVWARTTLSRLPSPCDRLLVAAWSSGPT